MDNSSLSFEVRVYPELVPESRTTAYMLQVDHWVLPPGAPLPAQGETLRLAVNKFQAKPEIADVRNFEVVDRTMFFHNTADGVLFRIEVTLHLKDLRSSR